GRRVSSTRLASSAGPRSCWPRPSLPLLVEADVSRSLPQAPPTGTHLLPPFVARLATRVYARRGVVEDPLRRERRCQPRVSRDRRRSPRPTPDNRLGPPDRGDLGGRALHGVRRTPRAHVPRDPLGQARNRPLRPGARAGAANAR